MDRFGGTCAGTLVLTINYISYHQLHDQLHFFQVSFQPILGLTPSQWWIWSRMVQKCATGEATTPPWCLKKNLPAYCSHSLLEGPVEIKSLVLTHPHFLMESSLRLEKSPLSAAKNHHLLRCLSAKSQLFQAQIPLICVNLLCLSMAWFEMVQ